MNDPTGDQRRSLSAIEERMADPLGVPKAKFLWAKKQALQSAGLTGEAVAGGAGSLEAVGFRNARALTVEEKQMLARAGITFAEYVAARRHVASCWRKNPDISASRRESIEQEILDDGQSLMAGG